MSRLIEFYKSTDVSLNMLYCVLLFFSVSNLGICCLENVGQLLCVNGEKNLLQEQTKPLRLDWGHGRLIIKADKTGTEVDCGIKVVPVKFWNHGFILRKSIF